MDEKLELLLTDGVIDEIHGRLKSGKEADIWIVSHGGDVVAAKIYKERQARSFKNNAAYREGRVVGNSRTQRAIDRGSRFGQAAAEEAWKSTEADALYKLHAHGVRTPTPVMFYEGVLLMQLVTDGEGNPAPRLIDAALDAESAGAIYRDLRAQVVRMLDADIIHGDLSPYNVLLGAAGPTIIDFPQIIAAAANNRAEPFFERDLENLRKHLAQYDRSLNACGGDAREIWRAYVRRELTPDFVPTGHAPEPRQAHGHPRGQGPAHPRRERQDAGPRDGRRAPPQEVARGRPARPDRDRPQPQPQQNAGDRRFGRPDRARPQQDPARDGGQPRAAERRPDQGRPQDNGRAASGGSPGGKNERPFGKPGPRNGPPKAPARPGPVVERVLRTGAQVERVARAGPVVERVTRPGPVVERVMRPLANPGNGAPARAESPAGPGGPGGPRRHERNRPPRR